MVKIPGICKNKKSICVLTLNNYVRKNFIKENILIKKANENYNDDYIIKNYPDSNISIETILENCLNDGSKCSLGKLYQRANKLGVRRKRIKKIK